MPPRKKPESTAPPASSTDRIGALPDSMLHHVLSFLPAQAAVRTCLLARRWRHLWRCTTSLCIHGLHDDDERHLRPHGLRRLVDNLLALRERTRLDAVEIKLGGFVDYDDPYVKLWTRFALMCDVGALTLHIHGPSHLYLEDMPLVSRHLRTLDLHGVGLHKAFLDFAGCPALERLKMNRCNISVDRISSSSLKHLSITNCRSGLARRVRVSAPGLVSLKLVGFWGRTPCLENMASLETACVHLGHDCNDVCLNCKSQNCVHINGDDSVILGGISSAEHLELISELGKFIFTRDLKHCPTFSKLKTLVYLMSTGARLPTFIH